MMKTLVIAAGAFALTLPAFAQVTSSPPSDPAKPDTAGSRHEAKFTAADTDKNGSLSIAEVKMADATVTQADFDEFDVDKSKSLSKAEFEKWAMSKQGDRASSPGQ